MIRARQLHRAGRALSALALAAAATVGARQGRAQAQGDKATAEAIFDDARRLMGEKKFAEACPKFAESQRLDPGVGVLLYLGDCYEKNGQLASAWATFREALSAARAAGQAPREKTARERAAALEGKLPRLSVLVPKEAQVEGLTVQREAVLLGKALWGTPVPVDPGSWVIRAAAPGKLPWSTKVELVAGAPVLVVTIPALADAVAAPTTPPALPALPPPVLVPPPVVTPPAVAPGVGDPPRDAPARSAWSKQKTAALAVGGAGVVGVVVGAAFGAKTLSSWGEAKDHCTGPSGKRVCDPQGVELASTAKNAGTASTIAFAVGGAALAAGAVLWITAPAAKRPVALQPIASPEGGGLRITGAF
jgi:serine/threonine-protein kinase